MSKENKTYMASYGIMDFFLSSLFNKVVAKLSNDLAHLVKQELIAEVKTHRQELIHNELGKPSHYILQQ